MKVVLDGWGIGLEWSGVDGRGQDCCRTSTAAGGGGNELVWYGVRGGRRVGDGMSTVQVKVRVRVQSSRTGEEWSFVCRALERLGEKTDAPYMAIVVVLHDNVLGLSLALGMTLYGRYQRTDTIVPYSLETSM